MNKKRLPKDEYKELILSLNSWTVYMVICADGTYFSDITRNMKKALKDINDFGSVQGRRCRHFSKPGRTPVKLLFFEKELPFREAYDKIRYMKYMSKTQHEKLARTQKWPVRRSWECQALKKSIEDNLDFTVLKHYY